MADKVGVIGLGYVGLPLAVELGKQFSTVGYDINSERIEALIKGIDNTGETSKRNIKSALRNISFSLFATICSSIVEIV